VRRPQLKQRQRQADVVIQIALGGQHFGAADAQNRRAHFLDRGLAIAAGQADQRNVETRAPVGGQRAQRQPRVGHREQRQIGMVGGTGGKLVRHQRADRALLQRRNDKIMAVEMLAANRHEQIADGDRARIAGHALKGGIRPVLRGADSPRGGGEQQHHAAPPEMVESIVDRACRRPASADFPTSASANG
jgi:hypothetical protein